MLLEVEVSFGKRVCNLLYSPGCCSLTLGEKIDYEVVPL